MILNVENTKELTKRPLEVINKFSKFAEKNQSIKISYTFVHLQ